MENHQFIVDFPIKNSIYSGFPVAMFDYRRVHDFFALQTVVKNRLVQVVRAFPSMLPGERFTTPQNGHSKRGTPKWDLETPRDGTLGFDEREVMLRSLEAWKLRNFQVVGTVKTGGILKMLSCFIVAILLARSSQTSGIEITFSCLVSIGNNFIFFSLDLKVLHMINDFRMYVSLCIIIIVPSFHRWVLFKIWVYSFTSF